MHTALGKTFDDRPRLLILEDDADVLQVMLEGLGRPCCAPEKALRDGGEARGDFAEKLSCDCADAGLQPCVHIVRTLRELHRTDLEQWDVALCASSLMDGSGLDALAFVRGSCPELPLILTGPPGEAALAVESIRAGAADFLLTTGTNLLALPVSIEKCLAQQRIRQENARLQADLSRSLAETAVKNRQLQTLIQQLETMARTDELTGLCNRRWFNLMLERSWAEALRSGNPLAFAMMDLDGFKAVNDWRGHQKGDELLRMTGRVIQANSRVVDLPARYGGDEFCMLLPNTDHEEAATVLRRIASAFDNAMVDIRMAEGRTLSMSVGISHINLSRPASANQLVLHADEALYAAKSAGKSRIMLRHAHGVVPHETADMRGACGAD